LLDDRTVIPECILESKYLEPRIVDALDQLVLMNPVLGRESMVGSRLQRRGRLPSTGSRLQKSLPFDTEQEHAAVTGSILQPMSADEYPHLREVDVQLAESRYEYAEELAFGLDLMLDGLARLRRQVESAP
jgi:hypothetical protein